MLSPQSQKIRTYLFNIINNNFEPFLRMFILEQILSTYNSDKWKLNVPEYTLTQASKKLKTEKYGLNEYMDTLYLSDLADVMIYKKNFKFCKNLVGENLTKKQFEELIGRLNETRSKVTHPYEINSDALEATISRIRKICHNIDVSKEMLDYLDQCRYEHDDVPPPKCINNLRSPSYELDGGFIPRPETNKIINNINRKLNRIIDIIGSGGVGKTAIAEYVCKHYFADQGNPFYAILFYSAKEKRLTERGILDIKSNLPDYETFISNLHSTLLPKSKNKIPLDEKVKEIYEFVDESKRGYRCLIVIDNLEKPTIFRNKRLRTFIKEFPRDSQIIITSRIGTDLPEERIKIVEMKEKQAVHLVKRYARARFENRTSLYNLNDIELTSLVNKVYCIPLLIKIAVGRHIELGQNIDLAFSVGGKKDKEAINFMLSETYAMLSPQAKLFLECMATHRYSKISRAALIEMTNIFDSNEFEVMVQQVEAVSLAKREIIEGEEVFTIDQIANKYLQDLLHHNEKEKIKITTKYRNLLLKIDTARKYLEDIEIEGITSELKESEYLAASHIAQAISFNNKRILNPRGAYDKAVNEFNIAKELAPWWYHVYMEYAFFEANWNHHDTARDLLDEAMNKYPNCEEFDKYQKVIMLINPPDLKAKKPLLENQTLTPLLENQTLEVDIVKEGWKKGDGIAYQGSFVIIVKNGNVGEKNTIKITKVADNYAFAEVIPSGD